jgi:hypothetical protein
VREIVQLAGSKAALDGHVDWILVELGIVGSVHKVYDVPEVCLNEALVLISGDNLMVSTLVVLCSISTVMLIPTPRIFIVL